MKVYEFGIGGEKEWYCANSIEQAKRTCESITCMDLDEIDEIDEIIEIPQEKWGDMKVIDPEREINGEHPVLYTFKEYMTTASKPDLIALTVY